MPKLFEAWRLQLENLHRDRASEMRNRIFKLQHWVEQWRGWLRSREHEGGGYPSDSQQDGRSTQNRTIYPCITRESLSLFAA